MRRHTVYRLERAALLLAVLILAGGLWLTWQTLGPEGLQLSALGLSIVPPQLSDPAAQGKVIGILAGHMDFDTGAVCPDGLQETQITQAVARRVVTRLEAAGAKVDLLAEKDARLDGYRADAMLSIHADSCIELSGFKAARALASIQPLTEDKYLRCVYQEYGRASGLGQHLNTVTHNMTQYYAFNRIDSGTPAVILELGFLGGDRQVLTGQQDRLAWGITNAILCFLRDS
jgi:N-acetylmuramoyl-L-alanine amidase